MWWKITIIKNTLSRHVTIIITRLIQLQNNNIFMYRIQTFINFVDMMDVFEVSICSY